MYLNHPEDQRIEGENYETLKFEFNFSGYENQINRTY